jgi:hypothetical protein
MNILNQLLSKVLGNNLGNTVAGSIGDALPNMANTTTNQQTPTTTTSVPTDTADATTQSSSQPTTDSDAGFNLGNIMGGGMNLDVSTIQGYIKQFGLENRIPADIQSKLADGKITMDEMIPIASMVMKMMNRQNNNQ